MSEELIPGFYGKVPGLGDFVTRRLSRAFVDRWDQWLQAAIASSRQQLGESWLELYLTSPLWRFALSPGLCGQDAWIGVMMPSVDRVGRYFPLTIAMPLQGENNPFRLVSEADAWYEKAEQVILSGLEDAGFRLEDFDHDVRSLGRPAVSPQGERVMPMSQAPGNGGAWHLSLSHINGASTSFADILRSFIQQRFSAYSLWWSAGSERVEPSLAICESLPPVEGFVGLLGGEWHPGTWDTWRSAGPAPHANVAV